MTTSHAEYARTALEPEDDGPPPGYRLLRQRTLTAQMPHQCAGCREASGIQPGTRYIEVVELYYGRLSIRRYCLDGRCQPDDEPVPTRRREPEQFGPDELPF